MMISVDGRWFERGFSTTGEGYRIAMSASFGERVE